MTSNEGYINVVAVMQKFFDQAISGNWSYNPTQYADNEVPMSVMLQDLLNTYKFGWKTSYYQNTYDFKGAEDDLDDKDVDTAKEDVKLNGMNGHVNGVNGHSPNTSEQDDEHCDACAI